MNQNVLVTIRGKQQHLSDEEVIETTQPGKYRKFSTKHVISYEEPIENPDAGVHKNIVKNLLKVEGDAVTLTKTGATESKMYFKCNESYLGVYHTPFGGLSMEINTTNLDIKETPDSLSIYIKYDLKLNGAPVSDCTIEIQVK